MQPVDGCEVRVSNLVATALFNVKIDLEALAWHAHGDYAPASFAAVQIRITHPTATALVFSSGRLVSKRGCAAPAFVVHASHAVQVTTGASSEAAAFMSVYIFYRCGSFRGFVQAFLRACRFIRELHPTIRIMNITLQNLVASADLQRCVRLDRLAARFSLNAIFDSSLFPGLRLQLKNPNVKILVFAKGRVVLTGARSREDLARAWATARVVVRDFLTDEDVSHRSLQVGGCAPLEPC